MQQSIFRYPVDEITVNTQNSPKGVPGFTILGDGLNGICRALAVGSGNMVYAGGAFTMANNIEANRIARWNGSHWAALGEGVDDVCKAIAVNTAGKVYAGGKFIHAGDVEVNHIAKWNGLSWEALGSGLPSDCDALAIDSQGNVYAGGSFAQIGELQVSYIAKWNPVDNTWSAIGSGLPGVCHALVFDTEDSLYAGGEFGVSKWNKDAATWESIGSFVGLKACYALTIGNSGTSKTIYAAGNFGVSKWDGTTWLPLELGYDNRHIDINCYALALDNKNKLFALGEFSSFQTPQSPYNGLAVHDGTNWSNPPGGRLFEYEDGAANAGKGYAICVDSNGNFFVGGDFKLPGHNVAKFSYTSGADYKVLLDAGVLDKGRVQNNDLAETDDKWSYHFIYIKNLSPKSGLIKVSRSGVAIGNIQSPSDAVWIVPVRNGETLTFNLSEGNEKVSPPYIAITDWSQRARVYNTDIVAPYSSSNDDFKSLPSQVASESSFDIYKIPPARIDLSKNQGGGIRQQIFKDLKDGDTNYNLVEDYALKPHFALTISKESKGSQKTSSVYGAQNFKKSLAANIEVGASTPNIGIEAKYGFSVATESAIAKEEVFSLSRVEGTEYSIDLVNDQIELTDDFVNDVLGLPVPKSTYATIEEAKADTGWANYRNTFIEKWGTHYPTQVIYGGYFWGIRTSSLEQITTSETFTENAEASITAAAIANIGAGVSTSKSSGKETKVGKEQIFFEQLGGSGGTFDSWASDFDKARAVGISLTSLENLMVDAYFKGKVVSVDLEAKRNMLKWALKDYEQTRPKYESSGPSLEIYELSPQSLVFKSADDDGWVDDVVEVFGKVNVKVGKYDSARSNVIPDDRTKDVLTIWDVPVDHKISFHRKNDMPYTMELKTTHPLKFYLRLNSAAEGSNRSQYGFAIEVERIWEHDKVNSDEVFTNKILVKRFDEITEEKSNLVFSLQSGPWEVEISAKVQRLPLGTIGLQDVSRP